MRFTTPLVRLCSAAFALSALTVPTTKASRFPGLDWDEPGGAAEVIALDQPSDGGYSTIHCSGSAGENRTCRVYNACFDASLRVSDNTAVLVVYTGADTNPPAMEMRLLGEDGITRNVPMPVDKWPPKGPLFFSGVLLMTAPMKVVPVVRPGRIPEERVAAWIDTPQAVISRHYLKNFAHVVCDDLYPLWWLLTKWMGWQRSFAAGNGTAAPTPAPLLQESHVGVLFWDNRAEPSENSPDVAMSLRLFKEWFPGLPVRHVDEVRRSSGASADGAKPLICFRSLTGGIGGRSMMRGAAYSFHHARTFDDAPLRPWYREYVTSQGAFVDFLLDSYGLPRRRRAAQEALDAGQGSGDVIVLNRRDGKRELRNVDTLIEKLRQSVGGRSVRELRLDGLPLREQAAAMQGADAVLGIHSAGSINLMFMRPGTAFVDLLPPRGTNYQPTMLALAQARWGVGIVVEVTVSMRCLRRVQRFDVRLYTMPLIEDDCSPGSSTHDQAAYAVDVEATRALVALAIGHEP